MARNQRKVQIENNFVHFAKNLLQEDCQMEGQAILNQYFQNLTGRRRFMPSRRQLLTVLRKEPEIYARLLHLPSGVHRTVYSMNPISTPVLGLEDNSCSERRYKRGHNESELE